MQYSFDMKVLGGLPVTVEFEGSIEDYYVDWKISEIAGHRVKNCHWLTRRQEVIDQVEDACYAYLNDL